MLKVEVFPVNAETVKVLLFTTIGAVTGGHKNHRFCDIALKLFDKQLFLSNFLNRAKTIFRIIIFC